MSVQLSCHLTNVNSFPFLWVSAVSCPITFQNSVFCLDMTVVHCNRLVWFPLFYTFSLCLVHTSSLLIMTTDFELLPASKFISYSSFSALHHPLVVLVKYKFGLVILLIKLFHGSPTSSAASHLSILLSFKSTCLSPSSSYNRLRESSSK